ncbi:hypothetical protein [Mammaliicoccus sciuri]|uniref:hypothetical protein n=1 Tax=Mammaliicoccus sciuri TaxID=1296 RepID=UPI0021D11757|nr:hypothetical protein [Mammaliicoccus sciuri]UXU70219.1 hypothetical protein MUA36_05920 [Mammaliicoccus sciuri]
MASLTKHELNRIAQLEEDIESYRKNIKTLKEVKESLKQENENLLLERDLYVGYYEDVRRKGANLEKELSAHVRCNDELGQVNKLKEQEIKELKTEINNLKQSVNDYKNLAEWHVANWQEYKALQHENRTLKDESKALRLQADEYFDLWQEAIKK